MPFPVSSERALELTLPTEADHYVLRNESGGSAIYYGPTPEVSASNNTGELTGGSTVELSAPTWIISAGHSLCETTEVYEPATGLTIQKILEGGKIKESVLPGSVVTDSFEPPASRTDGLLITVPEYADDTHHALKLEDTAGNKGRMLELVHYGAQSPTTQNFALDIHNRVGANTAIWLHQYASGEYPAFQIDQCSNAPALRVKQAENPELAPEVFGNGECFVLRGYTAATVSETGVVTEGKKLTDSAAAFVNTDKGKTIKVGSVTTTIAKVISGTEIQTASEALVNGSSVKYEYSKYSNVGTALTLRFPSWGGEGSIGPSWWVEHPSGMTITSPTAKKLLKITNEAGGGSTAVALTIKQKSAANALLIEAESSAAGVYPLNVVGYDYGPVITTNATPESGITLTVEHKGTKGGKAVLIVNKSTTGDSLLVETGSTKQLQVNATGVGLNGATPVGKASAIASPEETVASLKTAVDKLREAVKNVGITS